MFRPPPLGVGMVYFPAFEPFYAHCGGLLQVLEVEPQMLWLRGLQAGTGEGGEEGGGERGGEGGGAGKRHPAGAVAAPSHRLDERAFAALARWPGHKLVHGVGMPLAATVAPDARQRAPWRDTLARLQPAWVSEHLAFQRVPGRADSAEDPGEHSGFLLPALQCEESVVRAARRIAALRELSGRPVAFENLPNYLRRQAGELPDGEYYARVARAADCGILLDLHNLWCNELNGRQSMDEVMRSLPLERVWEIHLAGGELLDGFWLDAHSGLAPPPVMAFCEEWLPRLPNLGAMIFEVMPDYVQAKGLSDDQLAAQLEAMQRLWRRREAAAGAAPVRTGREAEPAADAGLASADTHAPEAPLADIAVPAAGADAAAALLSPSPSPAARWELTLGALANGRDPPPEAHVPGLAADPGVAVLRQLVESVRAGTLAEGLTLSWRLLVFTLGDAATGALMARFWRARWPQPFAADELQAFADFLQAEMAAGRLAVPHLGSVLGYELARAQAPQAALPSLPDATVPPDAAALPQPRWVRFGCDPLALLGALARGEPPGDLAPGEFELEVGA